MRNSRAALSGLIQDLRHVVMSIDSLYRHLLIAYMVSNHLGSHQAVEQGRTSPTFSYRNFSGVKALPLPRNARRASRTQDMGALCFSIAKVGSTDSIARGTGSLSSTKLLTAPGGRLSSCTGMRTLCAC